MISIAFPTHGSWQLGKFVNTEEDVNGYVTLKNQGTYIEMTNNTGQDLTGTPFFIDFIGSDFDALKWNLTPLSVLNLSISACKDLFAIGSDGILYRGVSTNNIDFGGLTDILYVGVATRTAGTIQYSTDGVTYNTYASVDGLPNQIQLVTPNGVLGSHIYFTDQYGNVLKFWRIALDYTHKYAAYIIKLETVDDIPILFTSGTTVRLYILTNALTDMAQNKGIAPFIAVHPQIPGYVAGYPRALTVDTSNVVVTDTYFTGVDTTWRLFVDYDYEFVEHNDGTSIFHAFGHALRGYYNSSGSYVTVNNSYRTYWMVDLEVADLTAPTNKIVELFKGTFNNTSTGQLTSIEAWFEYPCTVQQKRTRYGTSSYEYDLVRYDAVSTNQRLMGIMTVDPIYSLTRTYFSWGCKLYVNGNRYTYGDHIDYDAYSSDPYPSATTGFQVYLSNNVKIYKILKLGIPDDLVVPLGSSIDYYTNGADKLIRYYDISKTFTTGASGYWMSPIVDLGLQPPDFSVSWIADETYGRVDVDKLDPKEIEWRYSLYPPVGTAHGTITDSDEAQHAYWGPDTEWITASQWQKITSGNQLPPYRYVQFRISLQTD